MRLETITIFTMGLAALLALPATAAEEQIPITDPVLLESMGFEPDATNVYATAQALRSMAMTSAERAAAHEAARETPVTAEALSPFGTDSLGYSPIQYTEFYPIIGGSDDYGVTEGARYCVDGSPFYAAQIDALPHGAALRSLFIHVFDNSSEDMQIWLYRTCLTDLGGSTPEIEALVASGITSGCGGDNFCPGDPLTRSQMAAFLATALGLHWTDISQ